MVLRVVIVPGPNVRAWSWLAQIASISKRMFPRVALLVGTSVPWWQPAGTEAGPGNSRPRIATGSETALWRATYAVIFSISVQRNACCVVPLRVRMRAATRVLTKSLWIERSSKLTRPKNRLEKWHSVVADNSTWLARLIAARQDQSLLDLDGAATIATSCRLSFATRQLRVYPNRTSESRGESVRIDSAAAIIDKRPRSS